MDEPVTAPAPELAKAPPSGPVPTNGLMYSAIGGAAATVVSGIASSFGHPMSPEVSAGLATLVTVLIAYLHPDGRQFK